MARTFRERRSFMAAAASAPRRKTSCEFARLFLEGGSVDGVRILEAETIAMMMSDHLGEKAPERWKPRGLSWGFGAAVEYSEYDIGSGTPGQYGWVGGGFAKLWVDPKERLIAYFNFPMDPRATMIYWSSLKSGSTLP